MNTSSGDTLNYVRPVISCHENDWVKSNCTTGLNGSLSSRCWKMISPLDEISTAGHRPSFLTTYDFVMWMFPIENLGLIANHTKKSLNNPGLLVTSCGKVLRYVAILLLMTL